MSWFWNHLAIKIGVFVIASEIIVLTLVGGIYVDNFARDIRQDLIERVQIPGQLMRNGLLDLNTVADSKTMSTLVGEQLIIGLVVGVNQNIFFALDTDYVGKRVSDLTTLPQELFDPQLKTIQLNETSDKISSVAPVFAADGQTLRFYVYVEISTKAAQERQQHIVTIFLIGMSITVLITTVIIIFILNITLLSRIQRLAQVMSQAEKGKLDVRVKGKLSDDEFGKLEAASNSMIVQLKGIFDTLEQRVTDRTRDLQFAVDVSRDITTMLDEDQLLNQVAERTKEGFSLYHVGIFLYQKDPELVIFQAGTGESSQIMKAQQKQFPLTDQAIVTFVAKQQQFFLANDTSKTALYHFNELLPETRSELALPMVVGNQLIGVLDLQAKEVNRFTNDDLRVLTSLADQVAIAIQNANLFASTKAARERAEKSDRVKSAFLASMSHELRTPLNAIINFSKFLNRKVSGPLNEEQGKLVTNIAESGQHLLNLINDVLDMSKIESDSLKLFFENNVDLGEVIQVAVNYTKPLLSDKPVTLEYQSPAPLPKLRGDRKRLLQIMLNVLSNACKFTEMGSIQITTQFTDKHILIVVKDTGPGIASADYTNVFEPFKQTESGLRQGSGTGLGMPICRSLVEAHGGKLWFTSELGVGTEFFVELPLSIQMEKEQV